jgi:biotin carboxyl carrier protein
VEELREASTSLELIEASLQQGEVTCPVQCTVVRAMAVPGQFVIKGDPVVEVRFDSKR